MDLPGSDVPANLFCTLLQTNLHVSPCALNVEKFHEIRKQFHSEVLCFSPVLTVICGRLEKDRERTLLLVSSQVLHTGDPAQFDKVMEKMLLKIDCEGYMILCCHDCLICTRL